MTTSSLQCFQLILGRAEDRKDECLSGRKDKGRRDKERHRNRRVLGISSSVHTHTHTSSARMTTTCVSVAAPLSGVTEAMFLVIETAGRGMMLFIFTAKAHTNYSKFVSSARWGGR